LEFDNIGVCNRPLAFPDWRAQHFIIPKFVLGRGIPAQRRQCIGEIGQRQITGAKD
jgi:hypothetical protein